MTRKKRIHIITNSFTDYDKAVDGMVFPRVQFSGKQQLHANLFNLLQHEYLFTKFNFSMDIILRS